jgi:L-lactate permease
MSILKHILLVLIFAAFANMWLPHDVFLNFHQHEHTSDIPVEQGMHFDNQHHHCFQVQLSHLHEILPGFILGIVFLINQELKIKLFSTDDFFRLVENEVVRGPPASTHFNYLLNLIHPASPVKNS